MKLGFSKTEEDFRAEYAHRRLGFEDSDIENWLENAGLSLTRVETIKTQSSRPNVKIWQGTPRTEATQKASQ